MTDLFDRLVAKAGDGHGATTPVPPSVWAPGLVEEDVQTVPAMPQVQATPVVRQVPAPSRRPAGQVAPLVPARIAPVQGPTVRTKDLQPDAAPEPKAGVAPPPLRPLALPRDPAPPPVTRTESVAILTPQPAARVVVVPSATQTVPTINPPPPAPQPAATLQPMLPQPLPAPAPKPIVAPAGQPKPALPEIRINIGHIRVTAPQPAPIIAPAARPVQTPKGQALKAYLGWRR